jgi:quinol monooxygenase YgiN
MSPTKKKTPAKAKSAAKPAKPTVKSSAPKAKLSSAPAAQPQIDVLVWLRAKKGKEVPLERQLRILATASRAEPGCQAFALHCSDQPGNFFLHEIWSSEAALADHRQTPHFKRWVGLQGAILESRRRYLAE